MLDAHSAAARSGRGGGGRLKAGGTGETVNGKIGNGYDHTFCLTLGYKF